MAEEMTDSERAWQQYLHSIEDEPPEVTREPTVEEDDETLLGSAAPTVDTDAQLLANLRRAEEARKRAQANQIIDDKTYLAGVRAAEDEVGAAKMALKAAGGLEDVEGMSGLPSMTVKGPGEDDEGLEAAAEEQMQPSEGRPSPVDRYGNPVESKVRPEGFPPTPAKNKVARLLTDENIRSLAESGEFPADLEYREEPREYGGVTRAGTKSIPLPSFPFPQGTPVEEMYSRLGNEYEREDFLRKRLADVLRERAQRESMAPLDLSNIVGKVGEFANRWGPAGVVPGGWLISEYGKPFVEDEIIGRAKQIMQNLERLEELESERDALREELEKLQAYEASDQSYRGE